MYLRGISFLPASQSTPPHTHICVSFPCLCLLPLLISQMSLFASETNLAELQGAIHSSMPQGRAPLLQWPFHFAVQFISQVLFPGSHSKQHTNNLNLRNQTPLNLYAFFPPFSSIPGKIYLKQLFLLLHFFSTFFASIFFFLPLWKSCFCQHNSNWAMSWILIDLFLFYSLSRFI